MAVVLRSWRDARPEAQAQNIERQIEYDLAARRSLDPRSQIAILIATNLLATTPTLASLDIVGVLSAAAVLIYCERASSAAAWLIGYAAIWVAASLCSASADPFFASVGAMLLMMRKMYVIAMLATNLVVTVRVGELACALQRMHVPRLVIIALSVALRFFPTLAAEAGAVMDAMKLRGIRLSPSNVAKHPVKMIEYFAVPLILRVSVVTDEISRAATVRGIDSLHARTSLYDQSAHIADWAFPLWFAALTIVSAVLSRENLTFMGLF